MIRKVQVFARQVCERQEPSDQDCEDGTDPVNFFA